MGLGSVDLDFGEERKADAEILLAKGADFGLRAGFLRAELVAGEAQHCESAFFVGAVKQLQSSVLGGKAAFAGGVDDQQNLAMKLVQADRAAVQQIGGKLINRLRGVLHREMPLYGWMSCSLILRLKIMLR